MNDMNQVVYLGANNLNFIAIVKKVDNSKTPAEVTFDNPLKFNSLDALADFLLLNFRNCSISSELPDNPDVQKNLSEYVFQDYVQAGLNDTYVRGQTLYDNLTANSKRALEGKKIKFYK